jgi:hypothetical protein
MVDTPFFANDSFEGTNKADRRLAMHKLHSGLDLENVRVTIDMFCRGRVKRQMSRARHKIRNKKKTNDIYRVKTRAGSSHVSI